LTSDITRFAVGGNHRFNQRQRLIVIQRAEHGADRSVELPSPLAIA
jgi:hypothetical protein